LEHAHWHFDLYQSLTSTLYNTLTISVWGCWPVLC